MKPENCQMLRMADRTRRPPRSLRLPALFLAAPLARQRLLRATFVSRFQIERVLLDVLDDVFLLHLALEAAQCAFDRFALLHLDFSQTYCHLPLYGERPVFDDASVTPCDRRPGVAERVC